MKNIIILLVLVCGLIIMPSSAFCHGWANHEQGAKAHGMGGAFTGLADDPSAVYYNPAGITQVEGTQISLGFTIPTVRGNFKSAGTSSIPGTNQGDETEVKEQYFFVPNFYFTKQISDQLSFGVGGYSIFGLGGFEWPTSFEGRFSSGGINGELQTMTLSPVVAYEVSDNLSIAFGGRIERADLDLQANVFVAPGVDEITSKISGYDYGMGWNAALLYHIHKELSIGLSYRSEMKHSFDDVDVEFLHSLIRQGFSTQKAIWISPCRNLSL